MAVLVNATWDRATDRVAFKFPYDPPTIDLVKSVPGSFWDKPSMSWIGSPSALAGLQHIGVKMRVTETPARRTGLPPYIEAKLRPYQLDGAKFLTSRRGALLTFEQRVGKTPTAIAAACAMLGEYHAEVVLCIYPAGVQGEWASQLKRWANVNLRSLEGLTALTAEQIAALRAEPYLFLGCHYEIIDAHEHGLHAVLAGRRFVSIFDEVQFVQNRKIKRTRVAWGLSHADGSYKPAEADEDDHGRLPAGKCVATWGLTGTPMRNSPKNLWAILELIQAKGAGTYWQFAKRYCAAFKGDYGWVDKGSSHEEELAARLSAISLRKTRAEVAPWLPKTDRKLVTCAVPESQLKAYRKLEKTSGVEAAKAIRGGGEVGGHEEEILRALVRETSTAKIPHAVSRAYEHTQQGKIAVFAHFHETLQQLENAFDVKAGELRAKGDAVPPHFTAGGWMTPAKRRDVIAAWKACPGPSILLANSKSSGTGIDLSDAWMSLFLELEWVPADFRQVEDRIVAVHESKRTVPPLLEYLLVRNTIDEAMGRALVSKQRVIQRVVGKDVEGGQMISALNDGGLVASTAFGLADTSDSTVRAALESIAAMFLDETDDGIKLDPYATAGTFEDSWDDDDKPEESEED